MSKFDDGPFENIRNKDFRYKKVTLQQRNWLADQVNAKVNKANVYAKRYRIPSTNIRKWSERKRNGHLLSDIDGKVGIIDEISKDNIVNKLKRKRKEQKSVSFQDYRECINEEAVETKKRRLGNDLEVKVSDSTVRRYKDKLNAKVKNGQRKSRARIKAEYDPRNSYVEACMFNAFQKDLLPEVIMNSDSTQYFAPNGECILRRCVYIKDDNDNSPITYEDDGSDEMGMFVKSFTLITAAGHMGPMVLLFSDDTMNEDEVKVIEIC
uniref:Uncharacterized protein n=1 Tax=Chromulina nebulosa TaxID=96789 RepID=A0A7S0SXS4_9STRA|mmetsp:Transcript_992/g.871  ORF Transcript_992/g.871 Transcript_992/m.871 type:complete len:266 (+) Transcript_992:34-831(+)